MVLAMAVLSYAEIKQVSASDIQKITGSKSFTASTRTVDGKTFFELKNQDGKVAGYLFDTGDFVNDVKGFNGPIRMLVYVSADGVLRNFQVIKSSKKTVILTKIFFSRALPIPMR